MAIYKRYRVEQKYIDGIPQEEYRLGEIYDDTPYHSLETCEEGHECILEYRWIDVEGEVICEGEASYHKQKRQQKCNTEEEWVDVYPQEFRRGELISEQAGECGAKVLNLYLNVGDGGTVDVNPNNPKYSYGETVTLTATPKSGTEQAPYYFTKYMYGSTQQYENETTSPTLTLTMYNDMFVKAIFGQETGGGYLYYSYPNGVESYYYYKASTLDKSLYNGDYASIIRDNEGVVTYMRDGAFKSASYLEEIYFPNLSSTESPFAETFAYCSSLKTAYIPKIEYLGVSAFKGCQELKSIDLPQLKHTDGDTFWGCTKLSYVSIPKLEELYGLFLYCSNLSSIDCPNVSWVHEQEFWYDYKLSDVYFGLSSVVDFRSRNFTNAHYEPFLYCHSSLRIHIPASLCSDYYNSYCQCCPCRYVKLSGEVSKSYCKLFVYDIRPEEGTYYQLHVSTTEGGSFTINNSKSSYLYPDQVIVTFIPSSGYSFINYEYGSTSNYGKTTSESTFNLAWFEQDWWVKGYFSYLGPIPSTGSIWVSFSNGTSSIYSYSSGTLSSYFIGRIKSASIVSDLSGGIITLSQQFRSFSYLTEINFSNVREVGDYCFQLNPKLKTVYLPKVESIGNDVFWSAPITTIDVTSVKHIGHGAFKKNSYLSSISLPYLSYLSSEAFYSCYNLQNVYFGSNMVVELIYPERVFEYCHKSLKIHVPNNIYGQYIDRYGSVSLYLSGEWTYYSNILIGDL